MRSDGYAIEFDHIQRRMIYHAKKDYNAAIKLGIAKEQARALLPDVREAISAIPET
jgi:thymidylate synthase ThyX